MPEPTPQPSDRLAEIKARTLDKVQVEGIPVAVMDSEDLAWLIAEAERLRVVAEVAQKLKTAVLAHYGQAVCEERAAALGRVLDAAQKRPTGS